MAFLWRGKTLEAFQQGHMPTVESCSDSVPRKRCEIIANLNEGILSAVVAQLEQLVIDHPPCDWAKKAEEQNGAWQKYYDHRKSGLSIPLLRMGLIQSLPGYYETFEPSMENMFIPPKLSEGDTRLLGSLALVTTFLSHINFQFVEKQSMTALFCAQTTDCNNITTRVLDFVWQVQIPGIDRLEVATMKGHTSLRVQLESGAYIYFNNAMEFLSDGFFDNHTIHIAPAWQIMSDNVSDLAGQLAKAKKFDDALILSHAAVMLDEDNVSSQYNLGVTLMMGRDWDGAIKAFRTVVALDPKRADAFMNLGVALMQKKDWGEAVAALRSSVTLNDKSADTQYNLGVALIGKKDWSGALAALRSASALNPQDTDTSQKIEYVLDQLKTKK